MSTAEDRDLEYEIRCLAEYPSDGAWKPYVVPFLLRLLDAERAKVARVEEFANSLKADGFSASIYESAAEMGWIIGDMLKDRS